MHTRCTYLRMQNLKRHFYLVGVSFSQWTYEVNEGEKQVRPSLVLSRAPLVDYTIQFIDTPSTATSKE